MTAMNTENAAMEAATIPAILDRVEKMASESSARWAELCAPYIQEQEGGEPYDEDYEDTLERKYQEGFSEAASLILAILKDNLPVIEKNIQREEGQSVLEWLAEVYGEGIEETGAWAEYFGEEEYPWQGDDSDIYTIKVEEGK